jgi:cell division protein FtsB
LNLEALMFFRKAFGFFSLGNLLLVATVALVLYMGSSFVQQIGTHLQCQDDLGQVEQREEAERQEQVLLEDQLERIQRDEAVEAWARENGLVKPGEVSVVIVAPPPDLVAQEEDRLEGDGSLRSGPEVWWDLFFGER